MRHFQRYIAFCMAFLVFGTSVVFAVDKHMCEDEVWSISYFGKAEACKKMQKQSETKVLSCCMPSTLEKQTSKQETQISKTPCCSQESFINSSLKGKENPSDLSSIHCQTAILSDLSESYLFSTIVAEEEIHALPPPPDIRSNFQSLFQVFII